ncbi:helix-turn-helix transcriptional regulator [Pumilibacter muris]|uniref:helix-turn-helix transcriptional regulator n=1 Tax=Pumilibacter muris TaxID=2941510 RepID=UPI00203CA57F|nr:helix-turn-helix transcriptional regulator [Pumilibacter muris]
MIDDVFMNRLRFLRKKHKLTQHDLAKLLHTTQNTISNWESGRQEPSYEKLITLSRLFHIPIEYLFGEDKKTQIHLREIAPRVIEETQMHGSDYSKNCLKSTLEEYNTTKEHYEQNKNNETLISFTIAKIHLENLLFALASDELLSLDAEYYED